MPGPGRDVPVAPASGVEVPSFCVLAAGVCDRAGDPATGVANLAVNEARAGDWDTPDSDR